VRQVFTDLPSPDMMRDVIIGAVARLRPALDAQETRRAELTQALSQLECQIGNLVDAIANGDDAGRPRSGIADREQKAAQLRAQLADLDQIDHVAALGTTNLMEELEKILGEWRGWIGGHPQQARQILGKLVVGRLTFTPKVEAGTAFYEFTGTGAL
jgi:hypothetical protein